MNNFELKDIMLGIEIDLTGKTAAVTGAASGIGKAVAQSLARAGAKVTVIDFNEAATIEVADEINGTPLVLDLSDSAKVEQTKLNVDILVNNAGLQTVSKVEEFDPERFTYMHRVMMIAPFLLTRAAIAGMYQKKWGRLIHISSAHGHRASPYKSAYISAKHGLEGFSKTIALEAGPFGVTSNTIAPAYVRTPLVEKQITSQAEVHGISEAEVIEKIMLTAPVIKRLIEPNEIGDVALFLCSESAGMITGTSIVVDGGWLAR